MNGELLGKDGAGHTTLAAPHNLDQPPGDRGQEDFFTL